MKNGKFDGAQHKMCKMNKEIRESKEGRVTVVDRGSSGIIECKQVKMMDGRRENVKGITIVKGGLFHTCNAWGETKKDVKQKKILHVAGVGLQNT